MLEGIGGTTTRDQHPLAATQTSGNHSTHTSKERVLLDGVEVLQTVKWILDKEALHQILQLLDQTFLLWLG